MIIKQVMSNCYNFVFPSTIAKILLSENSIVNFLFEFEKMKNMGSKDVEEKIKEFESTGNIKGSSQGTKKDILLNKLLSNKEYCYIPDFFDAFAIKDIQESNDFQSIEGPYLNGREILFFLHNENLLLAFTYFPFHNIKKVNFSDVLIREIKSYVFDNFSLDNFIKYVRTPYLNNKHDISLSNVMENKILTTRYSKNNNEILRLVKINDMYQWEFVFKTDNKEEN